MAQLLAFLTVDGASSRCMAEPNKPIHMGELACSESCSQSTAGIMQLQ